MNNGDWLSQATKRLEKSGIGTARLDALVLLEDATGHDRAYLLAHPTTPLKGLTPQKLEIWLNRRLQHEPLAYIRGKTEFYGHEFIINKHVLEPRPESETMIELLKSTKINPGTMIVDVGTGSGALAVTAKLEMPKMNVMGTDIDANCIKVAKQNAKKHKTDIKFIQTDLLSGVELSKNSILLCNLPYVPDDYKLNEAAMNEPKIAIFGGSNGLSVYRQLFKQTEKLASKPKYIFTESLPLQHQELAKIAQNSGYHLQKTDDFIQVFRLA